MSQATVAAAAQPSGLRRFRKRYGALSARNEGVGRASLLFSGVGKGCIGCFMSPCFR